MLANLLVCGSASVARVPQESTWKSETEVAQPYCKLQEESSHRNDGKCSFIWHRMIYRMIYRLIYRMIYRLWQVTVSTADM